MQKKQWFFKTIPKMIPDILAISGAVTISYGTGIIYVPLGYIMGGVFLIIAAVFWSKAGVSK